MMDPVTLLAAIGVTYYLISKKASEAKVTALSPEQAGQVTEMRTLAGGGQARYWRADLAPKLLASLQGKGLEQVTINGKVPKDMLIFRVVAAAAGFGRDIDIRAVDARAMVTQANAEGLAVLTSLSLMLGNQPEADKLVCIVMPSQRAARAGASTQFAILLDAERNQLPAPDPTGKGKAFDANMPLELVQEVNGFLADPRPDLQKLERAAKVLYDSGFPVAAKALTDRVKALRVKAALTAPGTPYLIRATKEGYAADLPFYLARHYTGNGGRFKEIVPLNPGMIMKGANPDPWKAGMTIYLPFPWKVSEKPMMRPLGVPATKPQPKPVGRSAEEEQAWARAESARLKAAQAVPAATPAPAPATPAPATAIEKMKAAKAQAAAAETVRKAAEAQAQAEGAQARADADAKVKAREAEVKAAEAEQAAVEEETDPGLFG